MQEETLFTFNYGLLDSISKLTYASGMLGATERRTAAYIWVREDSSTVATTQAAAEVSFEIELLKLL